MNWETGPSLLAAGMMAMAAWAVGRPVVGRLRCLADDPAARLLWALAVGSILWGLGLAGLGLLGLLYVPLIAGLTWAACLAGIYQLLRDLEGSSASWPAGSVWPGRAPCCGGPAEGQKSVQGGRSDHRGRSRDGAPSVQNGQPVQEEPSVQGGCLPPKTPGRSIAGSAGLPRSSKAPPADDSLTAEPRPLPYEHAPPPDLVGPEGLPLGSAWQPADPTSGLSTSDLAAAPAGDHTAADWEPLLAETEVFPVGGSWTGGGSRRRVDPAGHGLFGQADAEGNRPPGWLVYGMVSLTAGAVLAALVVALAPPTAGDALCYHLELPKRFLQSHRLLYLPYDDACTYPLLGEMWFLWAMALDGEVAAQLVHWQWGLMLAAAAAQLARSVVDRKWAWLAGCVVLLTPGVLNQMTAPLNDVALAAMTTLALAAWGQACGTKKIDVQKNSYTEDREWFLLAGLALGGAASIKYTAFLLGPVLAGLWTLQYCQQPGRRNRLLRGAVLAGAAAGSLAGLWYVRAAWYRGNPVYPFAQAVWPSHTPPPKADRTTKDISDHQNQALTYLAAPWTLTMQPEHFGGRGHQVGVLWLAALPGLLWTRRRRDLELLLAAAGGYFLLWLLVRPNSRFLLPALPMLAPGVVWVWMQMRRLPGWPRWVAGVSMAICLLIPAGWMGLRMRDHWAVALGLETRQEFLYRKEPSYPAAALANLLLPLEAKILSQDYRSFYFDPPVVRESVYRRIRQYDRRIEKPGDLARLLRQEGFTHLLLVENVSGEGALFDSTLRRLAEAELSLPQSPLQELSEYRMADADGAVRRYRLIAIR